MCCMKLPHWLMIGLWTSSVLAVLAAAGWWWVTWPERTAREFVGRLAADKDEQSWEAMLQDRRVEGIISRIPRPGGWSDVKPQPRTLLDVCVGQQRFEILGDWGWEFTAERDKVIGPKDETLLHLEVKWVDTVARRQIEMSLRQRAEARRQLMEQPRTP